MRKIIQKVLMCSVFFGLLIFGCQQDEDVIVPTEHSGHISIKRINGMEFKENAPAAFHKAELLVNKNEFQQRTVFTDTGLEINMDEILEIRIGDRVSYTLPVYRSGNDSLVENLVLTLQQDNTYASKIVAYDLSEAEKSLLKSGIFVDVSDKMSVESIEAGNILGRGTADCFDVQIKYDMCCHNVHSTLDVNNGAHCTCLSPPTGYTYVFTPVPCSDGGGDEGGDPPGDTPIDPGPSDGGGGDTGGGGLTQPLIPSFDAKPCNDLKQKSADPVFISNMQDLKNDANNPVESGFVMYNNAPNYSGKQFGGIDSQGSYLDLYFDPLRAAEITGFMHCHLNTAAVPNFAVFSMDDLVMFGQLIQNSTVPLEKLTMYVTSNKGTYALKIKDKAAFVNAINQIDSPFWNTYATIFNKVVKATMTPDDQATGLLNFFKSANLTNSQVFDLYQADSNFTNWKKLGVGASNNLTFTNC